MPDSGPMSRPSRSDGIAAALDHVVVGVGGERGRRDDVDREDELHPGLLGPPQVLADGVELVLLQEALADLVALGLQEGEHHAAADQDAVGLAEQVVDDAELVGDLGAAEHDGVGAFDVLGELLQHLDLGGDEAAGGVRQPLRHVVHRRVLAVHGAEAVADVQVGERGEPVGERAALGVVLAGLAGLEPQVLQQRDARRPPGRRRPRGRSRRRRRRRPRRPCRAARRAVPRRGPARTRAPPRPWGGRGGRRR